MTRPRPSSSSSAAPDSDTGLPGLRGRGFALLIAATAIGLCGFAAVLPLVPLWASRGGAGEFGAGTTTAVFMLTTVLTQLGMPWLLDRGAYRWSFPVGSLVLGLPTPLFAATADLGPLILVSAVRGIGFGMVTVAGTALAARLVPRAQVGRATGLYGLAVGLPQVVILPGGVAVALAVGFGPVFWVTGATGVIAAVLASGIWSADGGRNRPALRSIPTTGASTSHSDAPRGLRLWAALASPLLMMLLVAISASSIVTFLAIPLEQAAWLVSAALAVYALCVVVGRWTAGALYDQYGRTVLLMPAMVSGALGMGLVTAAMWTGTGSEQPGPVPAALILGGAALFGLGFGSVQNDTVTIMLDRAGTSGQGRASAVWNIGYDAGTGAGAMGLGLLIQLLGYGPAFAVTAVALLALVPLTLRTGVQRPPGTVHR
ncbi:MFS transporter [Nocardiopsis kunsanensis]|uniref:MFS transporter n=1 Tax=Nocardiopsis kunsanensis TaxID=141693 RepID=A0A918XAR0_9ACTN|nr:MFS transporter [Nocardiopsis kunsanensis]GHD22843.1 MFS transporter [Nocardiopsis kunsanensis]